jgi:prepilin-type processing-associated H-X9-DG protein
MGDISDGASYTIMVGERPPAPLGSAFGATAFGAWAGWIRDNMLWAIADSSDASDGGGCPLPAYFSAGDLTNSCHVNHFWSFHAGGGNWLLCDGSVRFMDYSAGTTVIPDMATIAGGEVIPLFD